jgi:hypothetical protein
VPKFFASSTTTHFVTRRQHRSSPDANRTDSTRDVAQSTTRRQRTDQAVVRPFGVRHRPNRSTTRDDEADTGSRVGRNAVAHRPQTLCCGERGRFAAKARHRRLRSNRTLIAVIIIIIRADDRNANDYGTVGLAKIQHVRTTRHHASGESSVVPLGQQQATERRRRQRTTDVPFQGPRKRRRLDRPSMRVSVAGEG